MPPHEQVALFVDVDTGFLSTLQPVIESVGCRFVKQTDFAVARSQLRSLAPDIIVASLRLAAFNGIHLAVLAKHARPETRTLIYSGPRDVTLASEVRAAGAFYERRELLPLSLPRFLKGPLPAADRRDAARPDRRRTFRGGRRGSDMPVVRGALT